MTEIKWCKNYLIVDGKTPDLEAVAEACKENKLLEYLCPVGEDNTKEAFDKWGTLLDPKVVEYDLYYQSGKCDLTIKFETAFTPPVKAYYEAEKNLPIKINAYYIEEDKGFVGRYFNGKEETYKLDYEAGLDNIPLSIIEAWALFERLEAWLDLNKGELQ